jgi:exodeoxyribonuclease VII small subunit
MSKKSTATEPDFEATLKQLEELVEKLESGDLGLADSLGHFEQGIKLSRQCHQMIDQARQTVELLSKVDDESSAQDFELKQPAP